jgi:hypothetical protein
VENENIEMMGNKRSITLIEDGPGPGKGRKQCKGCSKYVGVRTSVCECGYKFEIKATGRDLIPETTSETTPTTTPTVAGRGQKQCPKCKNIIGARSRACSNCNYIFAEKEETVEPHVVMSSRGFRSVATPAGFCPAKLQNTTFEAVGEWAEKVLSAGERNQIHYLPPALKYFVRHSFDIYSKEWREAVTVLNEWVSINLGASGE